MRGALSLVAVSKSFGGVAAVRDASLDVRPGELLTLLGPSGCGKTTILRLVAGLESPDAGRVLLSGRDVTDVPPHRRPVNTVFQSYALFPHRTVAGNVAFGLEMARVSRDEIAQRVARILETVRLPGMGDRAVGALSGGERQRVALARALVLEPEVLLLDEPMSALDRKLRQEMQAEVKALHERLGITFLFVTHDQEEALTLSDRIAVMNAGRIEQLGAPAEVYERPKTRFVADFLAVRNLLRAEVVAVDGARATLALAGGPTLVARDDGGFRAGERAWIGIRPERLSVGGTGENRLSGVLEAEVYRGDRTEWQVRVGDLRLTVAAAARATEGRRGEAVTLAFDADAVIRLDDGAEGAAS